MINAHEAREKSKSCNIEDFDKIKIESDILKACNSGLTSIKFYCETYNHACMVARFMESKFYTASVETSDGNQFYPMTYHVNISW